MIGISGKVHHCPDCAIFDIGEVPPTGVSAQEAKALAEKYACDCGSQSDFALASATRLVTGELKSLEEDIRLNSQGIASALDELKHIKIDSSAYHVRLVTIQRLIATSVKKYHTFQTLRNLGLV